MLTGWREPETDRFQEQWFRDEDLHMGFHDLGRTVEELRSESRRPREKSLHREEITTRSVPLHPSPELCGVHPRLIEGQTSEDVFRSVAPLEPKAFQGTEGVFFVIEPEELQDFRVSDTDPPSRGQDLQSMDLIHEHLTTMDGRTDGRTHRNDH